MKKLVVLCAMLMAFCGVYSQNLQKGNLVGMHVITLKLNPNFTDQQAIELFINKYIPASEENYPGVKVYFVKGIRGENENRIGMIAVFESEANRDKYYNKDGTRTELGDAANKKVMAAMEEFNKMGTFTTAYTDWIIQ